MTRTDEEWRSWGRIQNLSEWRECSRKIGVMIIIRASLWFLRSWVSTWEGVSEGPKERVWKECIRRARDLRSSAGLLGDWRKGNLLQGEKQSSVRGHQVEELTEDISGVQLCGDFLRTHHEFPGQFLSGRPRKTRWGMHRTCEPGGAVYSCAVWCVCQVPGQNIPLV